MKRPTFGKTSYAFKRGEAKGFKRTFRAAIKRTYGSRAQRRPR